MEYGLIGESLGHSMSPEIHAKFADYKYELHPLKKEELEAFMTKKDFKGINVTIPYKRDVIPYLDVLDKKAEEIGAVNTIVNRDGKLYGYNTDFDGFSAMLSYNGVDVCGKKVLVLGNGGVAKPILLYLKLHKAKDIIIVKYKAEEGVITYEEAAKEHSDADIIINATPVGMFPKADATPIDISLYPSLSAVIDIIANPSETKLVKEAKERGINAFGGIFMLVGQAKTACEYFTGKSMEDKEIVPVYEYITECTNKRNSIIS